jgi:hypothetical protein
MRRTFFRNETSVDGFLKIGECSEVDRHHRCGGPFVRVVPTASALVVVRAGRTFSIHRPVGCRPRTDAARAASEACNNTSSTAVGKTGSTAVDETGTAADSDSKDHTAQRPSDDFAGSTANVCDNSSAQSRTESGIREFRIERARWIGLRGSGRDVREPGGPLLRRHASDDRRPRSSRPD